MYVCLRACVRACMHACVVSYRIVMERLVGWNERTERWMMDVCGMLSVAKRPRHVLVCGCGVVFVEFEQYFVQVPLKVASTPQIPK